MDIEAIGTVVSVKKQWWLKVNTKAVRMGPFDGATFPHIIKVAYTVNGVEYTRKKWVKACQVCPMVGNKIKVVYNSEKPKKSKVIL